MDFSNERQIEQRLVTETRKRGGMALKFVSPSFTGMPDRLILLPDGKMAFVEVKAPGQKPRPLQVKRHAMLRKLGFKVFVLDAASDIPMMLKKVVEGDDAG
ncbi:MAG: VRR-NUC domain-containing protein [Megasphaera sp.]|jgi:hypothetical protein|uniref:VRR-NUC domain-containing protein n=1 Tax=Megasphaera sp. TaxID=2023260 RepID=UPI0025C2E553|nr:VRR-NUC domain-containing protein [Megasphaera sp.]MBS7222641.1 VRR-NUC domain-containing protein [Megasphaera sp.]